MKRVTGLVSVIVMMAAVFLVVSQWVAAAEDDTTRVSVSTDGTEGNGFSEVASVSGDGRFVAFTSGASNLVAGDSNGALDVFVHDRETGETELVSVSSDGAQGDSSSQRPSVSADGRFVAFDSFASNLVAGDSNDALDVFIHDRETGETSRLSVSSDGLEGNDISLYQSVSADGRFVAFHSAATNLVADDTNGVRDVFVHDRETGDTSRMSVSTDGDQANDNSFGGASVSGDGRFVAFESFASNLVVGDSNGVLDVFVHDRETGETALVSVSSDGDQGNANSAVPSVSGDGRFVAFQSSASNLVEEDTNNRLDVFVHDRETGDTSRVNVSSDGAQSDDNSFESSVSTDGRFVAFASFATNLVTGDSNGVRDMFVHDRESGEMSRVSVASDGAQANGPSDRASLSGDGQFVAFESVASNLVAGDTNGSKDVFVHRVFPDPPTPTTTTTTTSTSTSSTTTSTSAPTTSSTTSTTEPPSTEPPNTEPPSTEPPSTEPGDGRFGDVGEDNVFADDIRWLAESGITFGCNPPENTMFCPEDSVSRGEMAAFLNRALSLAATDVDHFVDDEESVFEDDINRLAEAGITHGCNPPDNDLFCPNSAVSRQEMASFLVRAYGFINDDPGGDRFTDDDFSVHEDDIEALAASAVTLGCNPPTNSQFCPLDDVIRGQMAAFLHRAATIDGPPTSR